jgi:carboxypeptidase A2
MSFIDETVAQNPDIASSYVAGQTYQQRNLKVIVLKTSTSKRNIWIDCGIHAREWVSPSTCVWIINKVIFFLL